tara:strand:+ start:80484 stop:81677 length:1194 start_codon:yes stop_codon:yes gene_type:complete
MSDSPQQIIDDFLEYLKSFKRYSNHTVISYRNDLKNLRSFLDSSNKESSGNYFRLDRKIFTKFFNHEIEQGKSAKTRARSLATFKSFYKYLINKSIVDDSPLFYIKSPEINQKDPIFIRNRKIIEKKCDLIKGGNYIKVSDLKELIDGYIVKGKGIKSGTKIIISAKVKDEFADAFNVKMTHPAKESAKNLTLKFMSPIDNIEELMEKPISKNKTIKGLRDKAILELFYSCGLRLSELVSLDIGSVIHKENLIKIKGKGNKERIVPIGRKARIAIKNYLNKRGDGWYSVPSTPLFFGRGRNRVSTRTVARRVKENLIPILKSDEGASPHTLRHTFGTHLIDNDMNIRVVQELLGHTNLSSTQIYTKVAMKKVKEVYKKSHPHAEKKNIQEANQLKKK